MSELIIIVTRYESSTATYFQVEFLDEKVSAMSISEFSENAADHRKSLTIPLKTTPTPELVKGQFTRLISECDAIIIISVVCYCKLVL